MSLSIRSLPTASSIFENLSISRRNPEAFSIHPSVLQSEDERFTREFHTTSNDHITSGWYSEKSYSSMFSNNDTIARTCTGDFLGSYGYPLGQCLSYYKPDLSLYKTQIYTCNSTHVTYTSYSDGGCSVPTGEYTEVLGCSGICSNNTAIPEYSIPYALQIGNANPTNCAGTKTQYSISLQDVCQPEAGGGHYILHYPKVKRYNSLEGCVGAFNEGDLIAGCRYRDLVNDDYTTSPTRYVNYKFPGSNVVNTTNPDVVTVKKDNGTSYGTTNIIIIVACLLVSIIVSILLCCFCYFFYRPTEQDPYKRNPFICPAICCCAWDDVCCCSLDDLCCCSRCFSRSSSGRAEHQYHGPIHYHQSTESNREQGHEHNSHADNHAHHANGHHGDGHHHNDHPPKERSRFSFFGSFGGHTKEPLPLQTIAHHHPPPPHDHTQPHHVQPFEHPHDSQQHEIPERRRSHTSDIEAPVSSGHSVAGHSVVGHLDGHLGGHAHPHTLPRESPPQDGHHKHFISPALAAQEHELEPYEHSVAPEPVQPVLPHRGIVRGNSYVSPAILAQEHELQPYEHSVLPQQPALTLALPQRGITRGNSYVSPAILAQELELQPYEHPVPPPPLGSPQATAHSHLGSPPRGHTRSNSYVSPSVQQEVETSPYAQVQPYAESYLQPPPPPSPKRGISRGASYLSPTLMQQEQQMKPYAHSQPYADPSPSVHSTSHHTHNHGSGSQPHHSQSQYSPPPPPLPQRSMSRGKSGYISPAVLQQEQFLAPYSQSQPQSSQPYAQSQPYAAPQSHHSSNGHSNGHTRNNRNNRNNGYSPQPSPTPPSASHHHSSSHNSPHNTSQYNNHNHSNNNNNNNSNNNFTNTPKRQMSRGNSFISPGIQQQVSMFERPSPPPAQSVHPYSPTNPHVQSHSSPHRPASRKNSYISPALRQQEQQMEQFQHNQSQHRGY